jgi:UDP-N-acetylmuramyl pentapeptide synthase
MREMGEKAEEEHERVAKKILQVVDKLVLVGRLTRKFVLPITKDKILTKWFKNSWQAGEWLEKNLRGGELILVKGSQNTIFTEIVVEKLLADKSDVERLCRRGRFWNRRREEVKFPVV